MRLFKTFAISSVFCPWPSSTVRWECRAVYSATLSSPPPWQITTTGSRSFLSHRSQGMELPVDRDFYTHFSAEGGSEYLFGSSPNTTEYDSRMSSTPYSTRFKEPVRNKDPKRSFWPFLEALANEPQPYAMVARWMGSVVRRAPDEKNTDQATFPEYLADNTEGVSRLRAQRPHSSSFVCFQGLRG